MPLEPRRANRVVRPAFWRKKTREMSSSRCVDTPTYPVFCRTHSGRGVTAGWSAHGTPKHRKKSKIGTAKCAESALWGPKVLKSNCSQLSKVWFWKSDPRRSPIIMLCYVNNLLLSRYSSESEVVLWEEFPNHSNLTISNITAHWSSGMSKWNTLEHFRSS